MTFATAFARAAREARWSRAGGRPRAPLGSQPPRILVAEDDFEMRRLISATLRRDYEVIEAKNGDELFDTVMRQLKSPPSASPIELIISDLRMPGLTGLQVLAELRASHWATPFILITAFGGEAIRNRALRDGAAAVFDKPFDMDDLRMAVLNLLGRSDW